ncbi:hypothetical protein GIB67_016278 [Kingdonia uniflora]|uniref:Helicase XPB/Ssl2 N-terminal domain-containing protein n=1 Tax=Kingdonia uniflora TaxID=39325 RepID=A0A7J7M9A8_9MAGN|nr:hypothetical protein GIB67_016278 [Kingdonia uniflora]
MLTSLSISRYLTEVPYDDAWSILSNARQLVPNIESNNIKIGNISISHLRTYLTIAADRDDDITIVRASIFFMIGHLWFQTAIDTVPLGYLATMANLDEAAQYDWGSAIFASLYHSLNTAVMTWGAITGFSQLLEVNGGSAYGTTTEMNSVSGTYDRKTIFKQMILSHCVARFQGMGGDKGRPSKKHKYSAKEDVRSRVIDEEDEYYHEDSVEDKREGKKNDFTKLELKLDHVNRPMWVYADGRIFLEMFSSLYKQAYDFLIAIAEPVCRPETMHEYNLTPHSLYVAVLVGLETDTILVLKKNRYFVESPLPEALKTLLRDDVISRARISSEGLHANDSFTISKKLEEVEGLHDELLNEIDVAAAAEEKESHAFEIEPAQVENVKQRCWPKALIYPMLEEYDFRNDMVNPDLKIKLLPKAQPRPYQEKSMSKMFGNGRARSGIIVLPCGARKSLVGVSAACRIRKSCLCLATNAVSVD